MPSSEPRRILGAGVAISIALIVVAYPFVLDRALAVVGVRVTALALLALAGASLALHAPPPVAGARLALWPRLAIAILVGLAASLGQQVYLRLVPALVYLALAAFFHASLRSGDSLIHYVVRRALPAAPDFIASYCRKLTALWAAFFLGCSLLVAALALWGSHASWAAWTGWGLYAVMLVLVGVEFLVRKSWFRYYFRGGPFDRLWARLFPAERTPRGRRSAEAIRRHRERVSHAAASAGRSRA